MGLDEKLFSLAHRFFKGFTEPPKSAYYPVRATLDTLQSRLHIISKSLCAEPIQILKAEKIGGFSGMHFYFPEFICALPSLEQNEWLYLQRALFYSVAKKNNLCLPHQNLSDIQKKIYTCLALFQVNLSIATEFPSFYEKSTILGRALHSEYASEWSHPSDTQNGLLTQWVSALLCHEFPDKRWQDTLCRCYASAPEMWEVANQIYLRHFAPLPKGSPLSDDVFVMWGHLMAPGAPIGEQYSENEKIGADALANGTEVQGKTREETVLVQLEKAKDENNPVIHSFEKVETLEEYDGGLRTQDGDDSLQDHAEALNELNIKEVTRSRERTNSIYKADVRLHGGVPEILAPEEARNLQVTLYPEWDYLTKSYKKDWCRVEVRKASLGLPYEMDEKYRQERTRILRLFEQVRHRPLWQKRQRDGVELDIDAVVSRHAEIKSGTSSEDRLYLRNKKHKKDFQCLLLLDCSLSTDSWVANERVLDVIKNSVNLIGEAFAQDSEAIGVAAFHSNTRHQCIFEILKGFKDPYAHLNQALTNLEPQGYTRIGPALRHSLELLRKSSARHKFIFLLSDGKASDYDRYEGRYGMEDIKQTLREAQQQKVHVKCLAIEENAKFYLPMMFGIGNVQILSSPRKLPGALTSLFLPLLR